MTDDNTNSAAINEVKDDNKNDEEKQIIESAEETANANINDTANAEPQQSAKSAITIDDDSALNPVYNLPQWLEANEPSFKPPVCNKLMYGTQLKVMFVGGPNVRKDYHIECGEEFFWQMRGNISLPIFEKGKRKIVEIREGFVFLLPGRVPHSPQRPEKGSVGLVIERDRMRSEIDALRYYVSDFDANETDHNRILWEKWFYCADLGTELPPIVREFNASPECESHEPSMTSVAAYPPTKLDTEIAVPEPFHLMQFIEANEAILTKHKRLDIFHGTQTFVRVMCGPLEYRKSHHQEIWIYVLKMGEDQKCQLSFNFPCERIPETLKNGDCLIINKEEHFRLFIPDRDSLIMVITMDTFFPTPDAVRIPGKYDRGKDIRTPWELMKKTDPHYRQRMAERGATEEEIEFAANDNDTTLDTQ